MSEETKTVLDKYNEAHPKIKDNPLSFKHCLALNDLEALQASVRELKARQVHILLAGIPIFLALLGPAIALIIFPDDGQGEKYKFLLYFFPIATYVLSFAFLSVFFQKATSIRRQDAYILLLQRYCSQGIFPEGYYGWNDTYAKYNKLVQDKKEIPEDGDIKSKVDLINIRPSSAFSRLVGIVFGTILISSLIISVAIPFKLDYHKTADSTPETIIFAILIAIPTIVGVHLFNYIRKYINRAAIGKKSFNYFVHAFEEILKQPDHYTVKQPLEKNSQDTC